MSADCAGGETSRPSDDLSRRLAAIEDYVRQVRDQLDDIGVDIEAVIEIMDSTVDTWSVPQP